LNWCKCLEPHKIALLSICWITVSVCQADEETELESQLDSVEQSLTQVKENQSRIQDDQDRQHRVIQDLDREIAALIKGLRAAERRASTAETQIRMLREHQSELVDQKLAKEKLVKQHLRAAARLGQRGLLKVLLNQEDPNQIARLSQNYKYLSAAQLREISAFEELIQKLVDNETQLNLEVARASEACFCNQSGRGRT
jgi:septal ring factor EnvC (AmiA/AmiB activator)